MNGSSMKNNVIGNIAFLVKTLKTGYMKYFLIFQENLALLINLSLPPPNVEIYRCQGLVISIAGEHNPRVQECDACGASPQGLLSVMESDTCDKRSNAFRRRGDKGMLCLFGLLYREGQHR
jgi:hypothetical protein